MKKKSEMWYCDFPGCKSGNFTGHPEAVHEEGWTDTPEGQFCPFHKPKCQHTLWRLVPKTSGEGIFEWWSTGTTPVPNKFCPKCGERLSDD